MKQFTINSNNFENCQPYLAYENDKYLVMRNADIVRCFEIEDMPQIFSSSNKEIFNQHDAWVKALNCLPVYTVVHKQDVFTEGKFVDSVTEKMPFLRRMSASYFNGKKYIKHRCYIYIIKSSKKQSRSNTVSSFLSKKMLLPPESYDMASLGKFDDAVAQFCHILEQSDFKLRELNEDELFGAGNKFGLIEKYLSLNFTEENDVLSDILFDSGVQVGDKHISCFCATNLKELPDEVYPALRNERLSTDVSEVANCFVSDLCMGLGFNHIYNQFFFIIDNKETFAQLEKDGKKMESFSAISRENSINKAYNDAFLDEAHAGGKKAIYFSFNITTWDTYKNKLLAKNSQIASALALLGLETNKVEGVLPQIFWAGLPGNAGTYPSEVKLLTFIPHACCFINFESNYRNLVGADKNGIKLTDRQFGVPVLVDVSNYPMECGLIDNKNKFILGSSGSGKSFFTNAMVSQKWMCGDHIVIVDVGDSYQTLCNLIKEETKGEDGVYFTYKDDSPVEFNPFYVEDYLYTEEKIMNLCTLIQVLWKTPSESSNNNEVTQLRTGMQMYIDKLVADRNIRPCFNTFYEFMREEFKNYIIKEKVRIENFDIDNFLQVLKPYYMGGTYDYLLNSEANVDLLKKRFVVFELDNIKDNKVLFPVVTLIIMDTFISKMRLVPANERKMMLIEEAWKAISQAGMAEFIKYLYKTVRKHNGEVAVVTQEPDDLMDNPIVKDAIINSADVKILLDLSKFTNRFDKIKSALALSDKDAALALSVNKIVKPPYKEVFISFNGKFSSVYRVETSWAEALSFTSKKEEKAEIYSLKEKTGSMRKGILEYIRKRVQK